MITPTTTAGEIQSVFKQGLAYEEYVASGKASEVEHWRGFHARVKLTEQQKALLAGFTRAMNVLVVSGTWCGDCVQQCPMLEHIVRAAPLGKITLRFVDRDGQMSFAERFKVCGGVRVPIVLLLNEDFEFCAQAGDRTLSRYRSMAARQLGGACPLPGAPVPIDEIDATLQDWVDEFERVQLMLRLSSKLRQRHGD